MRETLYDWCVKNNKKELLKDWDCVKNNSNNLFVDKVSYGSGIRVSWKCRFCGYEWESKINNRTINNRNCPSCTIKTTSFGEQTLYYYVKKLYPDAINRYRNWGIELDIYIPSKKLGIEFDGYYWHNSNGSIEREKKKYAICKKNSIKLIRIKDEKAKKSLNTCDKSYAIENLKDIEQLSIIIRILLKDLDHSSNFMIRKDPLQIWSTIDSEITPERDRFDILEDKYIRTTEDSFAKNFPELLKDWNYEKNKTFNPYAFTKASTIKVWWKCHVCNQEWQAKIVDITSGHSKCPVCSNKLLKEGFNDFATLYPELLHEWDYENNTFLPNKILKKWSTKVFWKCKKCGHKWIATLGDRTRKDKPSGCPQCRINNASLTKHIKAVNRGTIADTHPEYLEEWDYDKNNISPKEVTFGSGIKVWWKCKFCRHSWQSTPNNRIRRKSKCPKCKYKKD